MTFECRKVWLLMAFSDQKKRKTSVNWGPAAFKILIEQTSLESEMVAQCHQVRTQQSRITSRSYLFYQKKQSAAWASELHSQDGLPPIQSTPTRIWSLNVYAMTLLQFLISHKKFTCIIPVMPQRYYHASRKDTVPSSVPTVSQLFLARVWRLTGRWVSKLGDSPSLCFVSCYIS